MFYAVRITDNGQYTQTQLESFANKHTNLKLIMEYKDYKQLIGKHYHGWIEADVSNKAIIKWITQELRCKGNKDYSISQKEPTKMGEDAYKRYCCKGENDDSPPTEYYNISQEDVVAKHKDFWEQRKNYKPESKQTITDKLQEWVSEHKYIINNKTDMMEVIIKYFEVNKKIVSNNQLESYYHYLMGQECPNYSRERAVSILTRILNY